MELLYVWINRSGNGVISEQGFNFSPKYNFRVEIDALKEQYRLSCKENQRYLTNFFDNENTIVNMTALVGKNGSGKTTLLQYLYNHMFFSKDASDRKSYDKFYSEQFKDQMAIYIYEDNSIVKIFHNIDKRFINNTKFEVVFISKKNKNEYKIQNEDLDYENVTRVYLTNSNYTYEIDGYGMHYSLKNICLTSKSLRVLAKGFYKKIAKIDTENYNDYFFNLQNAIVNRKTSPDFQQICDLKYFKYLIDNNLAESFNGKVSYDINISFSAITKLLIRNSDIQNLRFDPVSSDEIDLLTIYDKFDEFIRKTNDIDLFNIINILYLNLLFELHFSLKLIKFDRREIKNLDTIKKHIRKLLINTNGGIRERTILDYYINALNEIETLDNILSQCNTIESPLPKEDLAYDFGINISYAKNQNIYFDFINLVDQFSLNNQSFVLKYLVVKNLKMSSGERAYLNFFSWLNLLRYFNMIEPRLPNILCDNVLLLIDEIELYSHPEWQRKFVYSLVDEIKRQFKEHHIQIIFATHSPLVLSDIPKSNTLYLSTEDNHCIVDDNENHSETFGANIYRLYDDAFFLKEKGEIGEFAKNKINTIIHKIKQKEKGQWPQLSMEILYDLELEIDTIGEPIIKEKLREMLQNCKYKDKSFEQILLEREKDRIEQRIAEINKK